MERRANYSMSLASMLLDGMPRSRWSKELLRRTSGTPRTHRKVSLCKRSPPIVSGSGTALFGIFRYQARGYKEFVMEPHCECDEQRTRIQAFLRTSQYD